MDGSVEAADAPTSARLAPYLVDLFKGSISMGKVAELIGTTRTTISRHLAAARAGNSVRKHSGRKPVIPDSLRKEFVDMVAGAAASGSIMSRSAARQRLADELMSRTGAILTERTFGRFVKRLGSACKLTGTGSSTQVANEVDVVLPFFVQLKIHYLEHPLLLKEPMRLISIGELLLPLKVREKFFTVPSVESGEPLTSSTMKDGSARVSLVMAVSANGHAWPNSYYVARNVNQRVHVATPHPAGITAEHLDNLFICPTDKGGATKAKFFQYLLHLLRHVRQEIPSGPLLFFFDMPSCHATLAEIEAVFEHDPMVLLLPFPANTATIVSAIPSTCAFKDRGLI